MYYKSAAQVQIIDAVDICYEDDNHGCVDSITRDCSLTEAYATNSIIFC